jgi:hypothetical protein
MTLQSLFPFPKASPTSVSENTNTVYVAMIDKGELAG